MTAENKKPPVLKIFQKLEEQHLKIPETPEKIDSLKIRISSPSELPDLK
jgi:hypothetical protein